jgi:predicted DNA-binding transcriptional regulator YafY
MPQIKNALIRFRIIDRCIRNQYKPYPSKLEIREACEDALYGTSDGENICDSTIEKDLFAMRMEHDAPIKYSKRHGGYYYTDPAFSMNDIPLTEDDIEAIKFATKTLSQFKDMAMFQQFGFAIDKIVDRVTIAADPSDKTIADFVQFDTPIRLGGSEFLSPLLSSIRKSTAVFFDYESFQSQTRKARKVLPLLLKEYSNRWYLLSFDVSKEAIITYALDRMYELQESEEILRCPIDFKPEQFFRHAIGITASNGQPDVVEFKADNVAAKYIASQPFHATQTVVKEGKNKTTFEMTVFVSEELIRSLLSYGGEVEVVKPDALREQLAKRARAILGYNY